MTIALTVEELAADPHPIHHRLRASDPVAWIGPLEAWLVTRHDLCMEVMLDPGTFTVDDPRFSTAQVIGPSMLSLDGLAHRRHRDPFAGPFRAARINELRDFTVRLANDLIGDAASRGEADLRADVSAPLAVGVMAHILDLDVGVSEVLGWYEEIVDAVHTVTEGGEVPDPAHQAFRELSEAVARNRSSSELLGMVESDGALDLEEIASNVAVLLFGGIVTSESSSSIAFRYLLDDPDLSERLRAEPSAIAPFVEETLRLEPSASAIDRYATRDVELGQVTISEGDLVRISLAAANRDPSVFESPDRIDLERANQGKSVTFARGPHACLGIHLARLETIVAVETLLSRSLPEPGGRLDAVEGLVFRAPGRVQVVFP